MTALFIIIGLALVVFLIATMWKVFTKAGRPGWAVLIPIYNTVVQFQIAKMNPWLVLLYILGIIPIVGSILCLVLNIVVTVKLGNAFNKGTGFILGLIFLPFIFFPILAFGSSTYDFDDEEVELAVA